MGRGSRRGGGAQARLGADARTIARVSGAAAGKIQAAAHHQFQPRGPAQDRDRQDPQISAEGAVLGGEREKGAGVVSRFLFLVSCFSFLVSRWLGVPLAFVTSS